MKEQLGELFINLRGKAGLFRWLFFAALAALVLLNLVLHPHHPHFGAEKLVGFWAGFGLGIGVFLIYLVKKILTHLVSVPEDFYERD